MQQEEQQINLSLRADTPRPVGAECFFVYQSDIFSFVDDVLWKYAYFGFKTLENMFLYVPH